ncbi:MAG: hypothetical protein M3401_14275 [Actinomycetota bacterium]|nr:hypothetical protein [Actinomycetota bacterium]
MGRESANYWLALPSGAQDALARALERSDAELLDCDDDRLDFCLRDPNRYWVDLRIHRGPELRLEIRIALTNDAWSIREPLQRALEPLPPGVAGTPLLDDAGDIVAIAGEQRWWYAVEADYERRRDEFVAVVGDFFAPISTDHVYRFLHQARKSRDIAEAAAGQRQLEVEQLKGLWKTSPPAGEEDELPR